MRFAQHYLRSNADRFPKGFHIHDSHSLVVSFPNIKYFNSVSLVGSPHHFIIIFTSLTPAMLLLRP